MKAQAQSASWSEMAALRQHIEREYEAGRLGLTGFPQGAARYAWITARIERLTGVHTCMCGAVGTEQVTRFLVTCLQEQDDQEERKAETNDETSRADPGTD